MSSVVWRIYLCQQNRTCASKTQISEHNNSILGRIIRRLIKYLRKKNALRTGTSPVSRELTKYKHNITNIQKTLAKIRGFIQ